MKKVLITLLIFLPLFFNSCKKEELPTPNQINFLMDEEPQALVDSLETLFFDNPMTSDVSSTSEAIIMDYPEFMDYDPFTVVSVRRGSVDLCVRGLEITKEQREKLNRAWSSKIDCQRENKKTISLIHRNIENWSKNWKADMWKNWYIPQKTELNDKLKRGLISEREYKNKIDELNSQWESKMKWHNGQVREKIKNNIDRATACGKIKDCEKIWLNSVLEIVGREKYKNWIRCYKHHYKRK